MIAPPFPVLTRNECSRAWYSSSFRRAATHRWSGVAPHPPAAPGTPSGLAPASRRYLTAESLPSARCRVRQREKNAQRHASVSCLNPCGPVEEGKNDQQKRRVQVQHRPREATGATILRGASVVRGYDGSENHSSPYVYKPYLVLMTIRRKGESSSCVGLDARSCRVVWHMPVA